MAAATATTIQNLASALDSLAVGSPRPGEPDEPPPPSETTTTPTPESTCGAGGGPSSPAQAWVTRTCSPRCSGGSEAKRTSSERGTRCAVDRQPVASVVTASAAARKANVLRMER